VEAAQAVLITRVSGLSALHARWHPRLASYSSADECVRA